LYFFSIFRFARAKIRPLHFNGHGYVLFVSGIVGLNIDPYVEDRGAGRVRHLYIRQAHRRKGCATLLMDTIVGQARSHFRILRLFTANPAAAAFYEHLGFEHLPGYKVSHVLSFVK